MRKRLISILTTSILLAGSLILPFNNVKVAAVTTVNQKSKDVTKTVTKSITVNDNLLTPQQSIFPSSMYSYLNKMSCFIQSTATNSSYTSHKLYNTVTGDEISFGNCTTGSGYSNGFIYEGSGGVFIPSSEFGIDSSTTQVGIAVNYCWDGNSQLIMSGGDYTNTHDCGLGMRIGGGGIWFDPGDQWSHLWGCSINESTFKNSWHRLYFVFNTGAYDNSLNAIYIDGVKQSMHHYCEPAPITSADYCNISQWNAIDFEEGAGYSGSGHSACQYPTVYNQPMSDLEISMESPTRQLEPVNYNTAGYVSRALGSSGINGYNYLKVGGRQFGNADNSVFLPLHTALKQNTNYTLSAYVRIPISGTCNGQGTDWGELFTTNDECSRPLNFVSSSGECYTARDWKRVWVTFNTGNYNVSNPVVRFYGTDIPEIDVTALKLEESDHPTPFISYGQSTSYGFTTDLLPELSPYYGINNTMSYNEAGYLQTTLSASKINFTPTNRVWNYSDPITLQEHFTQTETKDTLSGQDVSQFDSSISINQDGYSGTIPRTGIDWTANWVTNRYSSTQYSSQTSPYLQNLNQWNYPSSVPVTVYDSATSQNVTGNIGLSRTPTPIMSAVKNKKWYRSGYVMDRSTGNIIYKNTDNPWIPWMSNNSSYYFGGSYSFYSPMPKPFHDYYGPGSDDGTWQLVDRAWGDDGVRYALDYGYPNWISDGDYGGVNPNRYARGVYLLYQRSVLMDVYEADYSGQIKLPDYISSYNGTANYDGTLSKSETQPGCYTANQWTVTMTYTGKEQAVDNPPVASFTINPDLKHGNKIHVGDNLNIVSNNSDPDPWDSIASSDWYYKEYVSDADASNPNSDYGTPNKTPPATFDSPGRYVIRNKVTDIGNPPYSGPFSNEYNGDGIADTVNCWHDVKVYPINHKPTALFSVDKQVAPNQLLNYNDQSIPNDDIMGYNGSVKDKITEWHWQWKKYSDTDTAWIDGQPQSFLSEGVYQIRLQVLDNGNYIPSSEDTNNDSLDDRLLSDWSYPQTVVVMAPEDIKPVNIHADSIQVLDKNDNVVIKVINGQPYRIKFVIENDTDNAIKGLFNTSFGLDVMDTDNIITLGLQPHEKTTLYSKYFTEKNNTDANVACFDGYANSTHTIIETNDDDNALSITLPIENETLAAPTAQFTVSSPVLINQMLTYNDTSHVNQSGATIANRDWKWCTDGLSWNNFGQPASFNKPGTYYIEEQVEDSNGLFSEWYMQKVNVIVPTPVDDNLTVDQYTYKQDDNNYWVKPGDTFGITTKSYFPSDYGVYPSKTYLMLAKSNNTDTAAAPQEWETTTSKNDFGSAFDNELMAVGNNVAVQSQNNNNNCLTALHQFTAKNDSSVFNLYSKSGYLYGMTEYSNSYTSSGKTVKVDGIAPGYDSVADYSNGVVDSNVNTNAVLDDNLMLNLSVSNLFDKGSGVNSVYVRLYPIGQQNNAKQLSLKLENSNGYWDLNNIDAYALFKSADINIDFYAVDNVGNVGKIGTIKKELLTVHAEIAPYDTPDFSGVPTLEKGQKAVIKIYTTGYADTLAISFSQELVDKDSSLNKTLQITPQAHSETDVVFNVPRNIDEKQYTVKVLATNSVNNTTKESDPEFIVSDDILSGLRTGTLYDNP